MADSRVSRGLLKLYIGAAPGVGKTYKMLQEAMDLRYEGKDAVIGLIETHGRKDTEEQIKDLEQIPLLTISYKGKIFYEVNVAEIIRRRPDYVLIDELAHTNAPGSKNKKRYMDVDELLDAGINVLSAMNIQHLESVNDIVRQITGVKVRERVPDTFISQAEEIQIIDTTPETIRKRLSAGKIYAPDKIEQSLNHFFKTTNLAALRELALRELADDVDERIVLESGWPIGVHEKILVCVHYGPNAEKLIRRGWRMANRLKAELYVLTVVGTSSKPEQIRDWEQLAQLLNATFLVKKHGNKKPAEHIIETAKQYGITQILLGQSARTRWEEIRKGSIVNMIMRETSNIDLHIVADGKDG